MNGTAASPAVALARRVLPVPGGPETKGDNEQCGYFVHSPSLNKIKMATLLGVIHKPHGFQIGIF